MAFTERVRTGAGQQIEELDTSVAADAVRPEVVVRNPGGGSNANALTVQLAYPSGGPAVVFSTANDNTANQAALWVRAFNNLWNGATWDLQRNNIEAAI